MRFVLVVFFLIGCGAASTQRADTRPADADRDGVVRDRCADVGGNHQAEGDPEGCPESGALGTEADPDGDGVEGGADDCPTLPAPGSPNGCPPRAGAGLSG